jgi:hypothetical protein
MTNSKSVVVRVVALGAMMAIGQVLGCWGWGCDDLPFDLVESGDYVIVPPKPIHVEPGDEWLSESLNGSDVHIDREAKFATIRYTRLGTTYEVRYTLVPP